MTAHDDVVDITILGAGPVGLSAAYYAGHRDASVRIVESLEQLGGQVAAVYPEKHVYDVAGHPKILGTKLIELCAEQGLQYGPDVRLGEEVQTLERVSQNGEELLAIGTDKGGPYLARALIITAGHGAFEPRKLGIEDIDEWEGRGVHYFVREKDGDGSLQAVSIENTATGEVEQVPCEALITLLGFHSPLGAIADWGLELEGKRQIKVNPMTMETNLPLVFAAGDVAGYPGKITLITVGMGEAAIAANNAIAQLRGEKTQPKYSTD